MNEITDRLEKVIKWSGMSQRAFSLKIDFSYSTLNNYMLGKRDTMDSNLLINVLSTFSDINPDWLLHGKGEMLRHPDELNKVEKTGYDPPDGQQQIIEYQKDLIAQQKDLIKMLQEQLKMLQKQNDLNEQRDALKGGAAECADASGW